jgi:hypothetical protein
MNGLRVGDVFGRIFGIIADRAFRDHSSVGQFQGLTSSVFQRKIRQFQLIVVSALRELESMTSFRRP